MSNELHIAAPSGSTYYALVRKIEDGKVWDTVSSSWATWSDSNLANYVISLSNRSGDMVSGDFPTGIANNTRVLVIYYAQAGSSPATTDLIAHQASFTWSGDLDTSLASGSAAIRDYVRKRLGYPVIDVELTDDQIDFAIGDSLRNFNQVLCQHYPRIQTEQYGSVQIPLDSGCVGVTEVQALFPESNRVYAQMNIFEIMYRMVFPRLPIGDWYLYRSFYEMYQRIRGTEPDWRVFSDEETGARTLWVDCWSGPHDIYYLQIKNLTVDTLPNVHGHYFQKFLDLILAKCKITLSLIRGKFGGIPAPSGTITTDAPTMRQEGKDEEKELLDWLNKIGLFSAMPIVVG